MTQLALFPDTETTGRPLTLREQFEAFHADNPHVYGELRELALEMRRAGHARYSIKGLFEVLRHRRALVTTGEEFKLNNVYTAFYARLLMADVPELDGFFETREQRTSK